MSDFNPLYWLILTCVCAAAEYFISGFWFLWLAVAAGIVTACTYLDIISGHIAQITLFSILAILMILFTRPVLVRALQNKESSEDRDS